MFKYFKCHALYQNRNMLLRMDNCYINALFNFMQYIVCTVSIMLQYIAASDNVHTTSGLIKTCSLHKVMDYAELCQILEIPEVEPDLEPPSPTGQPAELQSFLASPSSTNKR